MALTYIENKGQIRIGRGSEWHTFTPAAMKQSNESLASEDSGRDLLGGMHINWIKPKLRKWEFEMPPMSSEKLAELLDLVQGKTYQLAVFDTTLNKSIIIYVYTSNSAADCYSGVVMGGLYTGTTFNAIEIGINEPTVGAL